MAHRCTYMCVRSVSRHVSIGHTTLSRMKCAIFLLERQDVAKGSSQPVETPKNAFEIFFEMPGSIFPLGRHLQNWIFLIVCKILALEPCNSTTLLPPRPGKRPERQQNLQAPKDRKHRYYSNTSPLGPSGILHLRRDPRLR